MSESHLNYRRARAIRGIDHLDLFEEAARASRDPVTPAQAAHDCEAMLQDLDSGTFDPPRYLMVHVDKILADFSEARKRGVLIAGSLARSDKDRRKASVSTPGLRVPTVSDVQSVFDRTSA